MSRKAWTKGEEQALRAMRRDGASRSQCAFLLGRSVDSVRRRLSELDVNVKQPEWTEEEVAVLTERYANEGSKVAECLGRSVPSVRIKASRMGLRFCDEP